MTRVRSEENHECSRFIPARRQGRHRHRRVVRTRRRLRAGLRRSRRRRGARRPSGGEDGGHRGTGRTSGPPGADGRRPTSPIQTQCQALVDATVDGLRPRRHPDQQRRRRHRGTRHPGDPRAVPLRHRRQPQRLVLDGAGLRTGHAAGQLDHQHRERPRHHHRRTAAGGLQRLEGRRHGADPRPGPAMGRPQGNSRQRDRAGLLQVAR